MHYRNGIRRHVYRRRQQIRVSDFDAKILLDQVLSPERAELARLKHEGLTSKEIGHKLGVPTKL